VEVTENQRARLVDAAAAVDARRYRETLGAFPTGVTVVTTTLEGVPHGITVSAFNALSLDPPLVLVCLATVSRGAALVARTGVLTVNVLSADQEQVSRRFADLRREPGAGAFAGLAVAEGRTGCPVLLGAVAHLDCRVSAVHVGGDHVIVVAEVVHLAGDPTRRPLVHQGGRYRYLAEPGVPDLQRAM
jgi:3-hydroxy-9,10-secoandrosta-1,3,5(10)-triene-9,17-dione monooxygenase reductase component